MANVLWWRAGDKKPASGPALFAGRAGTGKDFSEKDFSRKDFTRKDFSRKDFTREDFSMAEVSANKEIAAELAGFDAAQALGYAERDNGEIVILGPDGRKYVYSAAQIETARAKRDAPTAQPAKAATPTAATPKRAPRKRTTKK